MCGEKNINRSQKRKPSSRFLMMILIINGFGYSNYIDLYGDGKILCGVDDELKNKSDVFKIEKI